MTINNITYLEQFIPHGIFTCSDHFIDFLDNWDTLEVTKFINSLDLDKIYVLSLDFIVSPIQ